MKRVLTASILVPVISYAVLWAPDWLFQIVLGLIALMCFREFVGLAAGHGFRIAAPPGYAAGILILLSPRIDVQVLTLLTLVALMQVLPRSDLSKGLPEAGCLIVGVLYVFGCWRAAIVLRAISPYWLFFGLILNWAGDIAAYYGGRRFGRHRLAPQVSPNKSWEGSIASVLASVLFAAFYVPALLPATSRWEGILLAAAVNVSGQFGDLCESAIKRGANMKDSGSLLPGHGGWLDRVDSSLFALPVLLFLLSRPWLG